MASFPESMTEYKKQLKRGYVQEAYLGLMEFFRDLRSHLKDKYPEYPVSSSIYYGFMDMTFFSIFPESLKRRKLKITIVFVHGKFRFEVWLSGSNRSIQSRYWKLLKESDWNRYHLASNPKVVDYVIDHILVSNPNFADLDELTAQIERGTLEFIRHIEGFFSRPGN